MIIFFRLVYKVLCFICLLLSLLGITLYSSEHVLGEETESSVPLRQTMNEIYVSFEKLQALLLDRKGFKDPNNRPIVHEYISSLQNGLRAANKREKTSSDTNFNAKLLTLEGLLSTAETQLEDGDIWWARRRLKTVSNHCVSCHALYAPGRRVLSPSTDIAKGTPYLQGEMHLIGREFEKAIDSFDQAVKKSSLSSERMDALMKWLMVSVRFSQKPEPTLSKLRSLHKEVKLSEYNKTIINEWIESLAKWKMESKSSLSEIERAKLLLGQGEKEIDPLMIQLGTVELLRAVAILDPIIFQKTKSKLSAAEHRQALYLLGLSYSRLPSFLINELPDVFLEQCIRAYPGSVEAKHSFQLYRELLTEPYLFGNESEIPESIKSDILKLHTLAYGKG